MDLWVADKLVPLQDKDIFQTHLLENGTNNQQKVDILKTSVRNSITIIAISKFLLIKMFHLYCNGSLPGLKIPQSKSFDTVCIDRSDMMQNGHQPKTYGNV